MIPCGYPVIHALRAGAARKGIPEAYEIRSDIEIIRFMEVNDYLPSHVRVLTTPFDTDMKFSPYETDGIVSHLVTDIHIKKEVSMKDTNKINSLKLSNYGMIEDFSCNSFSNINLIIGENGTGKTFLLKS